MKGEVVTQMMEKGERNHSIGQATGVFARVVSVCVCVCEGGCVG